MNSNRNYLCTERAHFMCPNMHFGILAQIAGVHDAIRLTESLHVLQKTHPFLRSLIAEEEDTRKFYYQLQEHLEIPVTEGTDADRWQHDYDSIAGQGWNVQKESMLKVLVYPEEKTFQILFIAHHLLCDGRGLLQLVEEFAQHYVRKIMPAHAKERLIRSIHDLPPKSDLSFISKLVINSANRKWQKEKHHVLYDEYLIFEKNFIRTNPVRRTIHTIEEPEFTQIQAVCRQHGFSVNDYMLAGMMSEESIHKVIIAADIRSQTACYRPGAMGNYATAFSVVVRKKSKDMISLAKQIASETAAIRKQPRKEMLVLACYLHMRPELIDAVAIASLGHFESNAGAFVGKKMFGYGSRNGYSITNLGKIQSNSIMEAAFIPPASPANRETWGILTVNDHMKLCKAVFSQTK